MTHRCVKRPGDILELLQGNLLLLPSLSRFLHVEHLVEDRGRGHERVVRPSFALGLA